MLFRSRYYDHFPKNNICVFTYDEFKADNQATIKKAYQFLGVKNDKYNPVRIEKNISGTPRSNFLHTILNHDSRLKSSIKQSLSPHVLRRTRYFLDKMNLMHSEQMSHQARDKLRAYYNDDINRLSQLLNKDMSIWLK